MNILVVEDNEDLRAFLLRVLKREGHTVLACESVKEVHDKGYLDMPHDVIVLDLMLKGVGGQELIKALKKKGGKIPVLVLSSLSSVRTKVEMLNLGADDYLTKPFALPELLVRLKALHRRYLVSKLDEKEVFGDFVFYHREHRLERGTESIQFTHKENEIFTMLLRNKNYTVSSTDLLKIWGVKPGYHSNIVPCLVRRIRKKMDAGFGVEVIENVHGVGYRLVVPE